LEEDSRTSERASPLAENWGVKRNCRIARKNRGGLLLWLYQYSNYEK